MRDPPDASSLRGTFRAVAGVTAQMTISVSRMSAAPAGDLEVADLVRRAQRGDAGALRWLIERHHRAVHALVWRMTAGRGQNRVDDLVQECFVRVLAALPRFDPGGPALLSTWILTIATRLVINDHRRPELELLQDEPPSAPAEQPAAALDRARLGAAIAAAVARLPDGQRAVLVLREYHDLDYDEIAAALDLDLGTVKSRLARARHAVRDHLTASRPDLVPLAASPRARGTKADHR
jgi:RNA polymerase sigma-70 factor (ECF subfamily)